MNVGYGKLRARHGVLWFLTVLGGCSEQGTTGGADAGGRMSAGAGGAGASGSGGASGGMMAGASGVANAGGSVGGGGTAGASPLAGSAGVANAGNGSAGTAGTGGVGASPNAGAAGLGGADAGFSAMPAAGTAGVGGSGATAGTGGDGSAGACAGANPTTLEEAGACTGRPVGVALSTAHLSETEYAELARQFNYATPENEMKWDATEPTRNTFTFSQGDQIVDFAEANGMEVKGHALVWHSQLPQWVMDLTSATEVRSAMLNHIRTVMEHYRGKVIAWDVVNEAFDDDGVLRDSVFYRTLGASFIEEAFVAAREADPDVKLYYNDFDIENAIPKADAAYAMVADFKARGIPIDGVGMQMHTRSTDEDPPVAEFVANLERLLSLGVEVVISEMDVRVCDGSTLEEQAARYHDIVAECVKRAGCGAVTVWGITDAYSWLNDRENLTCVGSEPPRGLLWDDNYAEKPAFHALLDALAGR